MPSECCCSKCLSRIHLMGQLLDQSNLTCFYAQHCSLSNGENRRSLALSILELFKKYSRPSFYWTDSSNEILSMFSLLVASFLDNEPYSQFPYKSPNSKIVT